jgi:urate oxidase
VAYTLGHNQYGKAETRVVRVLKGAGRHELLEYNVSVALAGDLAATHLTGDNAGVLPTDTMKNTVYAFAAEDAVVTQPETLGLRLARHFTDTVPSVTRARVQIAQTPWRRADAYGEPHPHAFVRDGGHLRTATVTCAEGRDWVVSGVRELILLKSTDSEFSGFMTDPYTTLAPTSDRVMSTAVTAQWWHTHDEPDWAGSFAGATAALVETFAAHHSLALQQTLYAMGSALLDRCPGVAEVRLSLPNRHHFVVDLSPFGLANDNEVFHADDRPYGLIEGTVRRDSAPDPELAFDPGQGW